MIECGVCAERFIPKKVISGPNEGCSNHERTYIILPPTKSKPKPRPKKKVVKKIVKKTKRVR